MFGQKEIKDFDAVKVSVASPEDIMNWSNGEVTKAETINYRTLRPEVDGLMCERIFGPVKNYECHCGKYKGIRYKGIVCDKCGVEITHRRVRRHRMGHIELAVPVAHVWYSYGVPNKLAIILDIPQKDLNSVIYYSKYMITSMDEDKKKEATAKLEEQVEQVKAQIKEERKEKVGAIESEMERALKEVGDTKDDKTKFMRDNVERKYSKEIAQLKNQFQKREKEELESYVGLKKLTEKIKRASVIGEDEYDNLVAKIEPFFEVEMGASAIRKVLGVLDLDHEADGLRAMMKSRSKHKRMKAIKRLHLVDGFRNNGTRPEWLILTVLPVIPPELRPIIQLPGGRFATSDLNDLYRRVINRNNRLKRLMEIGAPDIILRNEKRMLQESVDALIDNEHRPATAVLNQRKQPYKSLSASLRGKKGRFRQNLLGKRVDYSARSVVVGDASLSLDECGLPRRMALELFKPFVIREIIARDISPNIRSAKTLIETEDPAVWDILEELVKTRPVLLNRAPTLHKHGIQAFYAKLVEGNAIRTNPLICEGFNLDFDGDQMAVHLPLTKDAVEEVKNKMLARHNLLKMSDGGVLTGPKKDMVQGIYYLTTMTESEEKPKHFFADAEHAIAALEMGRIDIHEKIVVQFRGQVIETSVGRVIFNRTLPETMPFINERVDKKGIEKVINQMVNVADRDDVVKALDGIKRLGFMYVTYAGVSFSINDLIEHPDKDKIIAEARAKEKELDENYMAGLITDSERKELTQQLWLNITDELIAKTWELYGQKNNNIYKIIHSGNNGSQDQLKQMSAIKGLLVDPTGKYVEMPIVSNFKHGLSAFEYFTNARGARKGLADTALRTARSGYLTRKLVIVGGDLIIREEDCGQDQEGYVISKNFERRISFQDTITGRYIVKDVVDPKTGEVIAEKLTVLDAATAAKIAEHDDINEVEVRSALTCKSVFGVCAHCYGHDIGSKQPIAMGEAVGVVAAQAMGEQSTQLTLRTFHFGGAQKSDITQGVPRIEELFEARTPKGIAYIADFDGKIKVVEDQGKTSLVLKGHKKDEQVFAIGANDTPAMKKSKTVKRGDVLYVRADGTEMTAPFSGKAILTKDGIKLSMNEEAIQTYKLSEYDEAIVEDGVDVKAGQQLTKGSIDPKVLMKIKGVKSAQEYVIDEVQKIYAGQGVALDEKHIELIARQMGNYIQIIDAGDTDYTPGQFASKQFVEMKNTVLKEKGMKPASYVHHLMGITNASLRTDSFLSAISFQEQVRVLTEAAILGKVDYLRGLLENVIIGRLIPIGQDAQLADPRELGEFKYETDLKSEN